MSDFTPAGGDTFQGRIVNREIGKVHDCIPRPGGVDEMMVLPCVPVSLFGQTQIWHRQH